MTKRGSLCALLLIVACKAPVSAGAQPAALKQEIESLHGAMVAAFRQDPATVARFYTDDASILGGGSRSVGREEVTRYWASSPKGAEWTLEVLEVGGDSQAPWVRGRSTLAGQGGRRFAADYVGILKRGADGQLRFYIDIYVGAPGAVMRAPGGAQ
jgi:ketosteroid isomerase-like protein